MEIAINKKCVNEKPMKTTELKYRFRLNLEQMLSLVSEWLRPKSKSKYFILLKLGQRPADVAICL